MLWIFNKKKIIKQNRIDSSIQTCKWVSEAIKSDIKDKGWKCESDIKGDELVSIIDNTLNRMINLGYKNLDQTIKSKSIDEGEYTNEKN